MRASLQLLRPKQWVKNGFVLAPILFAREYENPAAWALELRAALAFLLVSCVVYIFNDLKDRDEDAHHPVKRHRPLAAGTVRPAQAVWMAVIIALASAWAASGLPEAAVRVLAVYMLANLAYTKWLKHVGLLDVLMLAGFYVLRVLAGCYAIDVAISPWIVLTTFLLAMFLAFGKRYHEIGVEGYADRKANLQHYSPELLDRLVTICATGALLTYAIYAAEMAYGSRFEIVYSVAFVAFGLFRYLQQLMVFRQGGEPEMLLLKDPLMLGNLVAWLALCLWALA